MNPRDFLGVGTKLHSSPEEADRRTSVSRAYYALFLSAQELLETESVPLQRNYRDHQLVPEYLRNSANQAIEEIGDAIADLRNERNIADYDMVALRFNQQTCALLLAKARVHLQVLDGLTRPTRKAMVGAIKKHYALP